MTFAVVVLIVAAVLAATAAMAARRDGRVGRMPVEPEFSSSDMWPLSNADEGASSPYSRGASTAARLAGRR